MNTASTPNADRPNILLVMTDQQRGDCLGRAGHPDLLTPNLDALSHAGAYFQNAYSECPICIPARHAVMTGKRPQNSGVTGYASTARIADEANTLPNLLRRAGYQTATVGRSMHTHPHYRRYGFEVVNNNEQGDFYRKHPEVQPLSHSEGNWNTWPHAHDHGLSPSGITARPWHLEDRYHETNVSIRKAIQFLDERDREDPFFLYVGTVAPHPPLLPPACYYDRYDRDDLEQQPCIGDWVDTDRDPLLCTPTQEPPQSIQEARVVLDGHQRRSTLAGYLGLINHFDDQLQLLLMRLASEGLAQNTVVIFTSDHGEMLGDHHCFRKSMPYEGAAHIPFLMRGPGINPHTVVDSPVALMDILPTCCDLAGIDIPDSIDGQSLLPLLRGETIDRPFVHGTHSEMHGAHNGFHFLVDGRYKYIWWVGPGTEQLFDLTQDSRETQDLADDPGQMETLERFRAGLIDLIADAPEGFVREGRLVSGLNYPSYNRNARVE
ncbi:MAG: sulfatase-like hydrolase/transferase [Planctomycetota bacterium]